MDFDGNEALIVKYGVCSLCYSSLLAHLGEFKRPLRREARVDKTRIWRDFDRELHELYEASPSDLDHAAELLTKGLRARAAKIATLNQAVADVYEAIISDIETQASNWQYREDLARWQTLGRDLARRFYADSPYEATQVRLTQEVDIRFEHASGPTRAPMSYWDHSPQNKPRPADSHSPFGHREDCMAKGEDPAVGTIVVRFSFHDTFVNYLAYPFFFLHEYVSHVYATETNSTLFADGWLIYAAHAFFKRWAVKTAPAALADEQVGAFERYLLSLLFPKAQDGYFEAAKTVEWLVHWLHDVDQSRFLAITWELAALVPRRDVPVSFHDRFINAFVEYRNTDPHYLHRSLRTSDRAVELARHLLSAGDMMVI